MKFQPIQDFNGLSPQTTKGDLIARDINGAVRVAAGTDGLFLKADSANSAGVSWAAVSPSFNVTAQTANYSAVIGDFVICSSSSFTVTLPTAVSMAGKSIIVKHNGTSLTQVYQINTTSSQTISGPSGVLTGTAGVNVLSLYTLGEVFQFTSDGANWQITEHDTHTGFTSAGTAYITATAAYVISWSGNKSIVVGDTYTDGSNTYTVTTTANTTSGTFSGTGAPATTGTLTLVTGSGLGSIVYTSRTITGAPSPGAGSNLLEWSRNGRFMKVHWYMNVGVGSAGSGDYLITIMPSGATIDLTGSLVSYNLLPGTQVISNTAAIASLVGVSGQYLIAANVGTDPMFFVYSPTQVRLSCLNNGATFGNVGSGFLSLASASFVSLTAEFPIVGWQP